MFQLLKYRLVLLTLELVQTMSEACTFCTINITL